MFVDPDGRDPQIPFPLPPPPLPTPNTPSVTITGHRDPFAGDPFNSPVQSSSQSGPGQKVWKAVFGSGTAAPSPTPPDDQDHGQDKYRKPNEKLEKGDQLDMAKFDRRVKVEGEVRFQDQKSGYQITPDRAGGNSHGGSAFKLVDRAGNRVATLSSDGVVLRK